MKVTIWAGPKSWTSELTPEWLAVLVDLAADLDGRPWIRGQAWEKEQPEPKQPRSQTPRAKRGYPAKKKRR